MSDEENTTLLDDLATAWDAAEEEITDEGPGEAEVELTADPGETPAEEPVTAEGTEEVGETEPEQPEELASQETLDVDQDTAPKGLSPAAREEWANTPPAVRAELAKREKDFERGIQKYAQNAQRAQQMDQVLAPFQSLFAMNGGPGNTLPGLLQTANALQTGSEHVRAQTVANLIQQFGVPVNVLADVLEGKGVQTQPQQQAPDIQAEIQKALAPMFQQQQQAQIGEIQNEIDAFASNPQNEFYNDVRGEMADLMDIAAKNGQQLSIQDAYSKACMMRDDIRQIIQSRQSVDEVAQRRSAASSISGAPQGNEAPPQPESISDFLEQAWDTVGRR